MMNKGEIWAMVNECKGMAEGAKMEFFINTEDENWGSCYCESESNYHKCDENEVCINVTYRELHDDLEEIDEDSEMWEIGTYEIIKSKIDEI